MNKRELLQQKRRAVASHIKLNPTVIVVYRYQEIDNGFGVLVADYASAPTERVVAVRIAHASRESGPFPAETNVVGIMPTSGRYVLAEYNADIEEGDRVEDFKIGPIDTLMAYGGAVGKQALLTTAEDIEI